MIKRNYLPFHSKLAWPRPMQRWSCCSRLGHLGVEATQFKEIRDQVIHDYELIGNYDPYVNPLELKQSLNETEKGEVVKGC